MRVAAQPARFSNSLSPLLRSSYQQESWKTAVSYQLVHSGVLLLVATLPALPSSSQAGGARSFAAAALGSGIALFSGSVSGRAVEEKAGRSGWVTQGGARGRDKWREGPDDERSGARKER